jgi:hypothetical protein
LFLRRFVERTKAWAHFAIHTWTPKAKPGMPKGAEVLAARPLYDVIEAAQHGKRTPAKRGRIARRATRAYDGSSGEGRDFGGLMPLELRLWVASGSVRPISAPLAFRGRDLQVAPGCLPIDTQLHPERHGSPVFRSDMEASLFFV